MTVVLFATMSPTLAGQFNNLVNLAVILIIVPYIYSAVAVVKVVYDHKLPAKTFQTYKCIAIVAVIYCLWVIFGGDRTDRSERDGRAADQRAAVSILYPLDGSRRKAQGG